MARNGRTTGIDGIYVQSERRRGAGGELWRDGARDGSVITSHHIIGNNFQRVAV
jgi:hypothetical protein